MKRRLLRFAGAVVIGLGVVSACGFDNSLREYLSVWFWLPLAKHGASFERPNVRRIFAAFAGMTAAAGGSPLAQLRAVYQKISDFPAPGLDPAAGGSALAAARADRALTAKEREEVDLIDAKIDMREGEAGDADRLESARKKLETFIGAARTPEFRSEARGWLARVYYLNRDQTRAGKIYLDELNRNGSNLSREVLLDSLQMNYGYDGGPELLAHLEEYFDTAEHAAFAIQLATNPRRSQTTYGYGAKLARYEPAARPAEAYARIRELLQNHRGLFQTGSGASALTLLGMRTALRMGDPVEAARIADAVAAGAPVRREADFQWMLGSAYFLTRQYENSIAPLRTLFELKSATAAQRAAAAYGLCGVYSKTGNGEEQLRYALWLSGQKPEGGWAEPASLSDLSIYWAPSGWDLRLLLDAELPTQTLESFITANPDAPGIRLVKYSLAVRLSRENRYAEAAETYRAIQANRRAPRLERLSSLYEAANQAGISLQERLDAQYQLAEFIAANPDGIYFNDAAWQGLQRYALQAASDTRLTRQERDRLIQDERALKDSQEERWRAYLILRDCVREAGPSDLGRRAATLALKCLRGINTDRFGREQEIRQADIELSRWLRQSARG